MLVQFADLSEGLPRALRRPWAWVMSLEVAEHVPRAGEPAFVHNLVAYAKSGVVISWAPPGTASGHHHVNCQTSAYVRCVLDLLGFEPDARTLSTMRLSLQKARELPWLALSLGIFRRHDRPLERWEYGGLHPLPPTPTAAFIRRYLATSQQRCPYMYHSCNASSRRPTGAAGGVGAAGARKPPATGARTPPVAMSSVERRRGTKSAEVNSHTGAAMKLLLLGVGAGVGVVVGAAGLGRMRALAAESARRTSYNVRLRRRTS